MATRHYDLDVIVAGAGAGGAAAACYLGQAGLRVLVVEKARLPRHKPCGGAIPQATLARLPVDVEGAIRARPSSVRFTFPHLPPVHVSLADGPIAMVRRAEFDALLLAGAGAEVWAGQAIERVTETARGVEVQVGRLTLRARYLVAADGATSTAARQLGLRRQRRLGPTLEAEVPLDGDDRLRHEYGSVPLFALGTVPWGYAWVFPKGDCLSVGIGRFRPGRVDLRARLKRVVDGLGISLAGAELHGHPIPCYQAPPWPLWRGRPQERLATRRCVLVGDAAGLVDPFHGEGIRYAVKSAQLAAQAIARDDLAGYELAIWREIGHSLATAGLVSQWSFRLPWLCYVLGTGNPGMVRHFADVLSERSSYIGIGRRMIGLTVLWLVGMIDEQGNRR